MSIELLGVVAEFIGAIAIIVTLVYLSIQVKDSARASRSAAVTDATTGQQSGNVQTVPGWVNKARIDVCRDAIPVLDDDA